MNNVENKKNEIFLNEAETLAFLSRNFKVNVDKILKDKNSSRSQLAHKMKLDQSYLNKIINDLKTNPKLNKMISISVALEVPFVYLFNDNKVKTRDKEP